MGFKKWAPGYGPILPRRVTLRQKLQLNRYKEECSNENTLFHPLLPSALKEKKKETHFFCCLEKIIVCLSMQL